MWNFNVSFFFFHVVQFVFVFLYLNSLNTWDSYFNSSFLLFKTQLQNNDSDIPFMPLFAVFLELLEDEATSALETLLMLWLWLWLKLRVRFSATQPWEKLWILIRTRSESSITFIWDWWIWGDRESHHSGWGTKGFRKYFSHTLGWSRWIKGADPHLLNGTLSEVLVSLSAGVHHAGCKLDVGELCCVIKSLNIYRGKSQKF